MAKRLSTEEAAVIQSLVAQVHEAVGGGNWANTARAAEVSEFSLGEWRRGEGTPSAMNLMKLLRAAGVLGQRFELGPARAAPREEAGGLIAAVGQIVNDAHRDLVERLEAIAQALPDVRAPEAPQEKGG